jgi:dehydrogenase/reductase SDR family member 7B
MRKLANKTAIITGASSGIGKALALECHRRGMKVVMAARNMDAMKEIVEKAGISEGDVLLVPTDVSQQEDCRRLIETTVAHFGGIDLLINNAGISMRALFEEADLKVIERLMQVNFWGTVYCTKYALPHLLQSRGSLVGVSSIAGYKGLPARSGYSASKFAMQGFLETLRIENLKKGLHVLVACPGFTSSNIRKTALSKDGSPQGESPRQEDKMMSAEMTAWHILKAVEKRKRTLVLTSQGKLTVGLNKLFPSWVDRLVYNHMAKEPDAPFR